MLYVVCLCDCVYPFQDEYMYVCHVTVCVFFYRLYPRLLSLSRFPFIESILLFVAPKKQIHPPPMRPMFFQHRQNTKSLGPIVIN